jgi:glycosyltransferase involved in cell wall biosynthesis
MFTKVVSIGIPTYNRPDALRRILSIAVSQTYPHLEIIVSDNASSDYRVKEVVEEFIKKDARIKFYQQEHNKGLLYNTEFVLKQAMGEYFTWFSDDDWRSPEFVETLVKELEQNPQVNFAFCDYHEVYEDGSPALGYPLTHIPIFKPFTSQSRLKRILNYFWQDGQLGKANIFYSVFRKVALDQLDLKKISDNYTLLNMDCLIDFSLLQKSSVAIVPQAMCTLTCGNKKYYFDAQVKNNKTSILNRITNVWGIYKKDRTPYIKNTHSVVEKIIIYGLSLFKFLRYISNVACRSLSSPTEKNKQGILIQEMPRANKIVNLPQVTLVAVATTQVEETLQALVYSCRNIKFGKVKLLANYTPFGLEKYPDIEFFRINKCKSMDDWCHFIIYNLNDYIDTEFALLVHADGFVVNPDMWCDEFLQYDYIGAPWPLPTDDYSYRDEQGNIIRVGNSVSLRSKKLLELPIKLNLPWEPFHGNYHEDGFICVKNRYIYEAHGIKFASLEIAKYFSHERMIPEVQGIKPFVFHKWEGSNSIYPKFQGMGTL